MQSVDNNGSLLGDLALLLSTGEFSDVTFLVEGEELLGHRMLLASRSKYFRALLFGGMAESQQTKIELDVKLKPFKLILSYIYTERVELKQLDDEDFMDLLGLVHEYEMKELQSAVVKMLQRKLSLETCYWLYNAAVKYDLEELLKSCEIFLDSNAATFVKLPSFSKLTEPALKLLLKRDSFCAPQIDIFMAAKAWCEQFPKIDPKSILADVQYSLISIQDLVQKVKPTGLVDYEMLLKTIEGKFEGVKDVSNPLEHPLCISNGGFRCKNTPFTANRMCNKSTELYITFQLKIAICCIRFKSRYSINTALEFSADKSDWTKLHSHIAERTEKEIRFKKAIPVRFLRFHSYDDSLIDEITGISFV